MSISTRLAGLMVATALLAHSAAAQPQLRSEADGLEMPTQSWLPSFERGAPPPGSSADLGQPPGESGAAIESFEGYEEFAPNLHDLWDDRPARIESSGTWLRRGLWYAEADAVVMNRRWSRDDMLLAAEDPNVVSRADFPPFTTFITNTNRLLLLKGSQPGEDTSVRVTLGRFMHRDLKNRDHTAEFTVFGGGDWGQDIVLASEEPNGLFVPFTVAGGNRTFDESSRQTTKYGSHYSSFEINYRVKQRMGRDQIIMDPDGCWHRSANHGISHDYLVGLRILELRDIFDWRAEDIEEAGDDGSYLIRTDNDLFGFQMGAGFAYETARWSIGLSGKGGVYVNDVLCRSSLDFTADDDDDFSLRMATDELSFIGEARILGKWHLAPNFSLRAGCELMYVNAVALAPHQANFITEYAQVVATGDPFYLGATFGFEGYW